jgi:hypothetical protein
MIALLCFLLTLFASPFKSKSRLEAENAAVCTENLIRIDCATESLNVNRDDRALLPLPEPVRLAVQVKEPA